MTIKIDILLVNPRVDNRQRPPLGLAYIASVLKREGMRVAILDPLPSNEHRTLKKLLDIIRTITPRIVGFTATTAQIPLVYEFARCIKENYPEISLVVGGPHASALPEEAISMQGIDAVVIGEGEYTALELFQAILNNKSIETIKGICFKKENRIIKTEPRHLISSLDEIPYPARELLDQDWYSKRGSLIRGLWLRTATIIGTRGCPGQCTYCSSNLTFGRKIRRRSVQNVIGEIKELVKKYNIKGLFFCDDTLTTDKRWMSEFCSEIAKLKLIWACQSRVSTVNEKMLKEMKDAGCVQIEYGCESGSQKVLNALRKNITVQQIRNAFALTKKARIRAMANFMIGNPEEHIEDVEMSANLSKELDADYTEIWITTPYPGSELYRQARENGWLKITEWGKDWTHGGYISDKPVMEINFTGAELLGLRDRLYANVFSPMFKSSLFSFAFVYDAVKYILAHPLPVLNAILQNRSFVKAGLQIEKRMRGEKKDIILA
ncbi:cobalamin B12-binding domain-containing protein [archaeon]|nr:cobalamin B12-binding domain-containing protein [archaeon]